MKTRLGSLDSSPPRARNRHPAAGSVAPLASAVVAFLAGAAFACGGAARPDSTPLGDTDRTVQKHDTHGGHAGKSGDMGEMKEMDEMAAMPPEVKKFHEALAPRWHAEHGPQRMTDTCNAIAELFTDAQAIATSPPPAAARPADWSANAKQLSDAVVELDAICEASDAAAFERAFALVHTNFHGLMAVAGGVQHEDGKPEPGQPEHH